MAKETENKAHYLDNDPVLFELFKSFSNKKRKIASVVLDRQIVLCKSLQEIIDNSVANQTVKERAKIYMISALENIECLRKNLTDNIETDDKFELEERQCKLSESIKAIGDDGEGMKDILYDLKAWKEKND